LRVLQHVYLLRLNARTRTLHAHTTRTQHTQPYTTISSHSHTHTTHTDTHTPTPTHTHTHTLSLSMTDKRYPSHQWTGIQHEHFRGGKSQTVLLQLVKQILNLRDDEILYNFPHDSLFPGMHLDLCIFRGERGGIEEREEGRRQSFLTILFPWHAPRFMYL
jgi:hypothetical protein